MLINNIFQNDLHSCATKKEKKCGAHTHVHHLSQLLYTIFTSVVVYSRTTQNNNNSQMNMRATTVAFISELLCEEHLVCLTNLINAQRKKKYGAHTHARHLSHTLYLNIHGGCCLFSHNHNQHKKKQHRGIL